MKLFRREAPTIDEEAVSREMDSVWDVAQSCYEWGYREGYEAALRDIRAATDA